MILFSIKQCRKTVIQQGVRKMACSITIQIGDIKGESAGVGPGKDPKPHAGEIDVLSWQWGISQPGSAHSGPGAGVGKADVKDLTFTKYVDKATPNLLFYCFKGTAFKEAVLTVTKVTGDDKALEFVVIKLTGTVFIASVSAGDPLPNDRYSETVTLNFNKATFQYTGQKPDHTPDSAVSQDIIIA
jgi:type VI secretion system secreted protein Hcp